ncbi:histidine phosphatase family protein [Bacillus sp. HMF5848]|uniref:histidine phosphatase family protein n=1 Tax=Bacillus sp. HMF5848 TaxID=2495421 RepID=UPI000F7B36C1|nr:histidine phosphatase family protein [Bacillus sp. HMF5848]RSK26794.1 histidine phosphatase family protein [Bacillus sp. HMF5848]
MQILLIRHGQSEADLLDVHEGKADFELTELGKKQAGLMSSWISEYYPADVIWTSTLKRAKQTAGILNNHLACELIEEECLKEYDNGVLAGLPREEAARKYPEPLGGRLLHERILEGESELEFRFRGELVLSKILAESHSFKRVAIVSHGGMISKLLQAFLRLPTNNDVGFFTGDTGVHLLEIRQQKRIVHFLNSTQHLIHM